MSNTTTGSGAATDPLDPIDQAGQADQATQVLNEEAVAHVALAMQQAHHGPDSTPAAGEYLSLARSLLAAMVAIQSGDCPPVTVPAEPEAPEAVPLSTEQAA